MLEPFTETSVKTKTTEGPIKVVTLANGKTEVTKLRVLADVADYKIVAGTYAWVPSNLYATDWGKSVYESPAGYKFILVPFERILAFDSSTPEYHSNKNMSFSW